MPAALLDRIRHGRTDLVFELVASGGAATTTDADGVSLLQWCAWFGDVSALRWLLAHGAAIASLGDDLGLGAAAFHGHWRLCEFLLEQGADPNRADAQTGETPLHAALCKANRPSHTLCVEVLLARGADPRRTTRPGAPTGAFMRDAHTRGETPLHRAAAFGDARAVELLLAAGADVAARDQNGDTPLGWASWHLRPDAILRLLCHGPHRLHPARDSAYDHGRGHGAMDAGLLGRPLP
ncbi:MAG: ankyrin repeat domain-containing protein [Planctomycetes bacterium]|nr:ankyrin repeat domain-containing protein [Planctomycetota bacterium]